MFTVSSVITHEHYFLVVYSSNRVSLYPEGSDLFFRRFLTLNEASSRCSNLTGLAARLHKPRVQFNTAGFPLSVGLWTSGVLVTDPALCCFLNSLRVSNWQ